MYAVIERVHGDVLLVVDTLEEAVSAAASLDGTELVGHEFEVVELDDAGFPTHPPVQAPPGSVLFAGVDRNPVPLDSRQRSVAPSAARRSAPGLFEQA